MTNLKIFCVTDKELDFLANSKYGIGWVGKEIPPKQYISCNKDENIFSKEKHYSELTFHYWYWKNKLDLNDQNWIGFCQKRRYWIKKDSIGKSINETNISQHILTKAPEEWNEYDAIICEPIYVNKVKKMKMLKRGLRSLLQQPEIFFNENRQTILFHFDMHHGFGNLKKAIQLVNPEDRDEFFNYVNYSTSYNPHIMFIAKPSVANRWFEAVFSWLFKCEKLFGFENLKGYDTQRLYAYLAERYLSFWFNKYTKTKTWPWTLIDYNRI